MAGAPFYHPCGGLRLRRRAWGDPLLPVVARSSVDCGNRGDRGGDHASRSARPATRVVSAAAPTLYPMSCRPIGARQASPDLGLITPPLGRCFTPAADLPGLGKSRMRVMRNLPVVPLCTACKQKPVVSRTMVRPKPRLLVIDRRLGCCHRFVRSPKPV